VTEDDLKELNASFVDAKRFAQLIAEAKNVVSF